MARLTGIGGGIPKSSQTTCGKAAGAGTTDPYGGFMWLSWTGQIQSSVGASVVGIESRWVESTYGLMQSFYGDGNFTSGYVFLPVVAYPLSISGWILSAGEAAAAAINSWFYCWVGSFRTSGSYAIFTPLLLGEQDAACDDYTFVSLSGATADFLVGGFIISAPTG